MSYECGDCEAGRGQPHAPDCKYMQQTTPAPHVDAVDFRCGVCSVECPIAPDPPARAVCPEHCEDHDYVHDSSRAGKFCQHCDQEQPEDWR